MFYIVPITITDAMLVSSSVAETDYTAWSAGTAYSVGNRVMRAVAGVHANFERLVAGTTATAPENDPINWVRVGPTNRWAMLDGAVGTSTSGTASISVTLTPGVVRGLALLDLDVEGVTVTMVVDGDTVYTRVIDPVGSQEDVDSWYAYFFEAIQRRRTVVLTDLPAYGEAEITITATGAGAISIGSCVLGPIYELGDVQVDASVGIVDYSKKNVDDFGVVTVAERAYAKRMTLPLMLATNTVSVAAQRLARIRAKPVVWIGSADIDALINATIVDAIKDASAE